MRNPVAALFSSLLVVSAITLSGFAQSETPESIASAIPSYVNNSSAADFYVATNGNDANAGTLVAPFLTVDRARLAVQALKAHVSGRTIRVLIRGGVYYLPSTWTFSGNDSGTTTTPILYANYPGEAPVISGGQPITSWTKNAQNYWQTTLPSGTYFSQMWVNGSRRYRPRTTPSGYLYITGEYSTTGSTTTVDQLSYQTHYPGAVPANMANLADVELIDFEAWDVPHMRVASVDTVAQRITTTDALSKLTMFTGFVPGHRFLLENVKEALSKPGSFYLDRPTHVLTYIPMAGESMATAVVVAPRLQTIMSATGLSYVTFQGLTFAHSDWQLGASSYLGGQADNAFPAALSLSNSTGVIFDTDTIEHTGGYGIEFLGTGIAGGAPYLVQVKNSLVTDTGAGGIRVGEQGICTGPHAHTDQNVPQHMYIGNNLITGGGRVGVVGFALLIGDAHNVYVEHNEISDFYNTGIAVGYNWGYTCNFAHDDAVVYNYIHDLGQGVTDDLGGVYYLSGINTGNKILNNRVHDIDHDPNAGYGGWGLYVDAGASGVIVENNLVYRTTDASLHDNSWYQPAPTNPPPPPNIFRNNILAYGAMGVMDRHNDTPFLNMIFDHNIFYYDKAMIQYGYWYCQGKPTCTSYFRFDNNIYFNKSVVGGQPSQPFFKTPVFPMNGGQQPPITLLTFAQWQSQGEDKQSLFADPLFVDATPGVDNYTLRANSPAYSVGFTAFDPSKAGRLPTATLTAPVNAPAYPLQTRGINDF
jgi:hypothetical protein